MIIIPPFMVNSLLISKHDTTSGKANGTRKVSLGSPYAAGEVSRSPNDIVGRNPS